MCKIIFVLLWPSDCSAWAARWSVEGRLKPGISTWTRLKRKLLILFLDRLPLFQVILVKVKLPAVHCVPFAPVTEIKMQYFTLSYNFWAASPSLACPTLQQNEKVYVCVWRGMGGRAKKRRRRSLGGVSHKDNMKLTLPLDLELFAFQQAIGNGKPVTFQTREEEFLPIWERLH